MKKALIFIASLIATVTMGAVVARNIPEWKWAELQTPAGPTSSTNAVQWFYNMASNDASNGNYQDASGWGNHGTQAVANLQPQWFEDGLQFDGNDDYIDAGDVTALNATTAFSFEVWYKSDAGNADDYVFSKGAGATQRIGLQTGGSGFNAGTQVIFQVGTGTNTLAYNTVGSGFDIGAWSHVVGTFDGNGSGNTNRVKVYHNGVALTLSFSGTIPHITYDDSGNELRFGGWQGGGYASDGRIAFARVWDKTLTAAEVLEKYNEGR